jgi:tetratricopeptide (TPR) repeat protein
VRFRATLLIACGVFVYWNAMSAPFVLDDASAIVDNQSIQRIWPPSVPLQPPPETPVARRPLVNLSFAANHAAGGLDPRGYRAVNLAIHLLTSLVLFGVVRRTLRLPALAPIFGDDATGVAWVSALLWMLHPLNSEVVDYVAQRSESMMGLAYLLTLYCAIRAGSDVVASALAATQRARGTQRPRPRARVRVGAWQAAAVVCCATGMLCKESMVTAPLSLVLYDRAFLFESFRAALMRRKRLYAGLCLSWTLLAGLMLSSQRTTVGFSGGISSWTYLLNQARLVSHYLLLSVWPRSLTIDYGLPQPLALGDVLVPALLLVIAAAGCAILFIRRPRLGFGIAWFFVTLAPTSSIVPIVSEVGAERRMYLPLAGLVVTAVAVAYVGLRRLPAYSRIAIVTVLCLLAAAGTYARNREYTDKLVLARTIVDRWPNGRGHLILGTELIAAGRTDEGLAELRFAARDYPPGHYVLGTQLVGMGQLDEGLIQLREFIKRDPNNSAVPPAHDLIGRVLLNRRELEPAAQEFSSVLARVPTNGRAMVYLGEVRAQQGRFDEAIELFKRARQVNPDIARDPLVLSRLGVTLATAGRVSEAIAAFEDAVALSPGDPALHKLLGRAFGMGRRFSDAASSFRVAVQLAPSDAEARTLLEAAEEQARRGPVK